MSLVELSAEIARETRAAQQRMRVYQLAALGALNAALVMLEVSPGSSRERLRADSASIKRNASREREFMMDVAQKMGVMAIEIAPGLDPKTASDFSVEAGLYLGACLESQVDDNATQIEMMFGKIRILAAGFQFQGLPAGEAIELAREAAMKSFRFRFMDARGRVRQVDDRVYTLVNGGLHQLANEIMVLGLTSSGDQVAQVWRPDHPTDGQSFALSPDMKGFLALKEEVFHPRSLALVSRSSVTAD